MEALGPVREEVWKKKRFIEASRSENNKYIIINNACLIQHIFFISWQIFQFLSRAEPANPNLIIFLLLFIRKATSPLCPGD